MNKFFVLFMIVIAAVVMQNKLSSYVSAESVNLNHGLNLEDQATIIDSDSQNTLNEDNEIQGNNKFQFKTHDNTFMVKGVITANSPTSVTIGNQVVNIDSSVTGNVKTVGTVTDGAYAMAQGIIQNSSYYADKIIVDQRNIEEENETSFATPAASPSPTPTSSPTPTPTVTPTPTASPSPTATSGAMFESSFEGGVNMRTILATFENVLAYLKLVLNI